MKKINRNYFYIKDFGRGLIKSSHNALRNFCNDVFIPLTSKQILMPAQFYQPIIGYPVTQNVTLQYLNFPAKNAENSITMLLWL